MESMDSQTAEASVPWRRLSCTTSNADFAVMVFTFVSSSPSDNQCYWINVLDNYCKKYNKNTTPVVPNHWGYGQGRIGYRPNIWQCA